MTLVVLYCGYKKMKIAFKLAKIVGMDFAARTLDAYGNNSREYQTKNMYSNVYVAFFACIIIAIKVPGFLCGAIVYST